MSFVKGVVTGVMVGAAIGAMNSDSVMNVLRRSKKGMRRFRRKFAR
jgi:gas vesicle protein